MASRYSNKWLSANCPNANGFIVNKNYTKYFIFYLPAKKNVVELNEDMKKIESGVNKLIQDIDELTRYIDSQDYRSKTTQVKEALNTSVAAVRDNMTTLFSSCANRLLANAESDAWFGDTAANYARYINETILKR